MLGDFRLAIPFIIAYVASWLLKEPLYLRNKPAVTDLRNRIWEILLRPLP